MPSTRSHIALPDPAAVLVPLCAHLVEHDAVVAHDDGATTVTLGRARACLVTEPGALDIAIDAEDLAALAMLKLAIASHVVEFAPAGFTPVITWIGDGSGLTPPPDFRLLTVTGVETVTPRMRRIHFQGEDLSRFDSLEALHVRLFLPTVGGPTPVWPMLGEDGLPVAVPHERRPVVRKYTIRAIDTKARTLAIDFVLHGDAGPGSAFAERAQPGAQIGMAGPGGRGLWRAEWYIFLADATGLPAVARMLESLPDDAQGAVFVEVEDETEQQTLRAPVGITIRWLHRTAGAPSLLSSLHDALAARDGGKSLYLWSASEHSSFREIRAAAREKLHPGKDRHLIVSYWRAGVAEEEHAAEKRADTH